MGIEAEKEVCATCLTWTGKREKREKQVFLVSPSAKALCSRLKKLKPPHGGCNYWEKWK